VRRLTIFIASVSFYSYMMCLIGLKYLEFTNKVLS